MAEYQDVAGLVQFDPKEIETKIGTVLKVAVRNLGSGKLINISIFPELQGTEIEKGDFVVAGGKASTREWESETKGKQTSYELAANTLVVIKHVPRDESARSEGGTTTTAGDDVPVF